MSSRGWTLTSAALVCLQEFASAGFTRIKIANHLSAPLEPNIRHAYIYSLTVDTLCAGLESGEKVLLTRKHGSHQQMCGFNENLEGRMEGSFVASASQQNDSQHESAYNKLFDRKHLFFKVSWLTCLIESEIESLETF